MIKVQFLAALVAAVFVLSSAAAAQRSLIPEGFPDWTNTGIAAAGLAQDDLTFHQGGMTINTNGAVIENMYITGQVNVRANNVTIRNSFIGGVAPPDGPLYGINASFGHPGTVIENVTVVGGRSKGIYGGNMTLRRVNAWGGLDTVHIQSNVVVEDSYLHDLTRLSGSHNDGIQSTGGSNVTIRGNTIQALYQQQTSAIILQSNFGPVNNVLIEDNFLSGGTYTVYLRDKKTGHGPVTNATVRNNIWEKDGWQFGPLSSDAQATWSGNIYHTGEPFQAQPTGPRPAPTFPQPVALPPMSPQAIASQYGWQSRPIGDWDAPVQVSFDLIAHADKMDSAVGLLQGEAGRWTDMAAIVRFHPTGRLDARNGDGYSFDVEVPYEAGDLFHVRMVVDPSQQTYSVFIRPEIGDEVLLANGYAFRGEQGGTNLLDHFALRHVTGQLSVDNLTFGQLTAVLPGDANRDGRVDGEDFLIWQAGFGMQSGAGWEDGDFNGDGRVDGEDFLIWQAHFGSSAGSSAVTPEPAAFAPLLTLLIVTARRLRRCSLC